SKQNIKVTIFVPDITLDPTFGRTGIARGEVLPNLAKIPFSLMRERYIYRVSEGKLVLAPRLEKVKEGVTDNSGRYLIGDFEEQEMIPVENIKGEIVAEINPNSGNIGALIDGYRTVVHEAKV